MFIIHQGSFVNRSSDSYILHQRQQQQQPENSTDSISNSAVNRTYQTQYPGK